MIFCVYTDPDFEALEEEDKNIVLWAALLHDIVKRGVEELGVHVD